MDRIETSANGNQRERIIVVLRAHANHKGYVKDMDVQGIARLTGIDGHDVAKHLWGLQKQGALGFSTKHESGKTVPYRFRLKGSARMTAIEQRPLDARTAALMAITEDTSTPTPVLLGPPVWDTVPEPAERPSPALEPGPGIIQGPEATETPEEAVPRPAALSAYPEIEDLFDRREKLALAEQAADTLERAGLDDLAAQAMVAVTSLSPLEKEIIRFVEEHHGD